MFEIMFQNKDSRQLPARIMLVRIQASKSLSIVNLANEIGIHWLTLSRFLSVEADVRRVTLGKILEYINFEKTQLGLDEAALPTPTKSSCFDWNADGVDSL